VCCEFVDDPDPMQPKRKQVAAFVAKALGAWALAAKKPADAAKRLVTTRGRYTDDVIPRRLTCSIPLSSSLSPAMPS
jgi:hypothetical protein